MSRGQVWVQSGGRRGRRRKQQRRKLSAIRTWTPPLAEKQAPLDVGGAWKLLPLGAPHWWAQMQQNSNINSQRQKIRDFMEVKVNSRRVWCSPQPSLRQHPAACLLWTCLLHSASWNASILCDPPVHKEEKQEWKESGREGKKGGAVWLSARDNKHRCSLWFLCDSKQSWAQWRSN